MMIIESWLPVNYSLPEDVAVGKALFGGVSWQILETTSEGRIMIAQEDLIERWIAAGVLEGGMIKSFEFGGETLYFLSSKRDQLLCPVSHAPIPETKSEALAFSAALRATRQKMPDAPLQDSVYVERFTRLLPTFGISSSVDDDLMLGYWLTGGANVSAVSFRRLHQLTGRWSYDDLEEIVEAAGLNVRHKPAVDQSAAAVDGRRSVSDDSPLLDSERVFALPGRPELARFFREHIIDIITHAERYRALGIDFPPAVILHGPPGTGKTFAVERLIEFLGWPSFHINASSVASPYIHETSRKIAGVFEEAANYAPSVIVIDEMEAYLASRDRGVGHHRVEEMSEFLRRIPEAAKNQVLIIAMTNRLDMIDPAILRRGRFDHVVEVGYASEEEIESLLESIFASIPVDDDLDTTILAHDLCGRPLSDVAFVIREGSRLAARAGRACLDWNSLMAALSQTPARIGQDGERRIGFV